jgi:dephospho-CoA kinase
MSVPFQVGITGGIGSGKSTVATIFSCLGIPVYDADSHAKELMNIDEILVEQIKNEFGKLAYDKDGKLDRKFLADQVFGLPERLEKLNSLVHPRVAENYKTWVSQQVDKPYVLKEAALLFEAGSAKQLNKIIVVSAPEALRVKRVMNRDNRKQQDVLNIINRQWPEAKSLALANYIITNDDSTPVIPQVLHLNKVLLDLAKSFKS